MGFSRAELETFRDATVPDLVGPGLRLLFVGINPGLWTAAVQTHFARPGNRFWPALRLAGILTRDIDLARGMTEEDRRHLIERGVGISNLVNRATARADELTSTELRAGSVRLTELVRTWQPRVVAVAGMTAYRTAFAQPKARAGEQPGRLEGARLWVVPNPSGLNAHDTVGSLATAYAAPARAAGVIEGD
jgi:TDG/mug DNA glycosylase family protein